MQIRKLDYHGVEKARYEAVLITRDDNGVVVLAEWNRPPTRLSVVTFEPGDCLRESFYSDRWYNDLELRTAQGRLQGW